MDPSVICEMPYFTQTVSQKQSGMGCFLFIDAHSLVKNISPYLCIILLDSPGSYEAGTVLSFPLYR